MKLYHAPMTRSTRVRWLLGELGETCELAPVNVYVGEGRKPEYRAIHPHGYVPALELDGQTIVESAAICLTLADRHLDKGFAPPIGSALRAQYYQWMVYMPATCDPALETILFHTRFLPEDRRLPALVEQAKKKWASCERFLAKGLGDRTYLVGDSFTAADVMLGTTLAWAKFAEAGSSDAKLAAYLERMAERPAFKAAHAG
jgi:glutathione S-transferase